MRLLLLLLAFALPALADEAPYFRVTASGAISTAAGSSSTDPAWPPSISIGVPPTTPPGMGGTDPVPTKPHNGLLEITALPGWSWQVDWTGTPSLSQVQVYPNGANTVVELTIAMNGCALATVGFKASTGLVSFTTFRNDSTGPCVTPSRADWAAISGQPFPSGMTVVRSAALPAGNGLDYSDTSIRFRVAH